MEIGVFFLVMGKLVKHNMVRIIPWMLQELDCTRPELKHSYVCGAL